MQFDLKISIFLYGLYILWLIFAATDSMFTVAQMQSKGPAFQRGIPIIGHHTMLYLDALLPLLAAYLIGKYGHQWGVLQVVGLTIVGVVLSYLMHLTYIAGGMKFPEAPTYGGRLTMVGWLHLCYMAAIFATVGLFYLCTSSPSKFDVWLTTTWLVAHVVVGVHVPMKLLKPAWFPYHGIWNLDTMGPILGVAVILTSLSLWALR